MIKKNEKRTKFKTLINKHGLDHVLKNLKKYLLYREYAYESEYLRQLPYKLKKRYGKKKESSNGK